MIQAVVNNPYRILGVFSNSSRREIEQNYSKISRLVAAKKAVFYPSDLETVLGTVDRQAKELKKAKGALESSRDRLVSSFFWPILITTSIEAISAIDLICAGRLKEAIAILNNEESLHSCVNRAFVGLLNDEPDIAVSDWFTVFESETLLNEYIGYVCGDEFTISPSDCKILFLNALCEEYGAINLYQRVKGKSIPAEALSDISLRARNSYVGEIDELLIKYPIRKGRPSFEILFFADNLQKQSQPLLEQFSLFCEDDQVTYSIYADKLAERINQLVVAAYNEAYRKKREEKIDELEIVGPNSADILKRINRDSLSRKIADTISKNLTAIEKEIAPYEKKKEEERKAFELRKDQPSKERFTIFSTKEEYIKEFDALLSKYSLKSGTSSYEILYTADKLQKLSCFLIQDFTDFCKERDDVVQVYADKVTNQLVDLVIAAYNEARKNDETGGELLIIGPNSISILREIQKGIVSHQVIANVNAKLQFIEDDLMRVAKKTETAKIEPQLKPEHNPTSSNTTYDSIEKNVDSEPTNEPKAEGQACALCGTITTNIEKRDYKKVYERVGNNRLYTHWDIDIPMCEKCLIKEKELKKWKRVGEFIVIGIALVGILFFINDFYAMLWYIAGAAILTFGAAPFLGLQIGKLLLCIVNPELAKHTQHTSINMYPPVKKARKEGFRYENNWW